MARVPGQFGGLLDGVTEQPDPARESGAVLVAENTFWSLVDRHRRRPPSSHRARLEPTNPLHQYTGDPLQRELEFTGGLRFLFHFWHRRLVATDPVTGRTYKIINRQGAIETAFDYLAMPASESPRIPLLSGEGLGKNQGATQEAVDAGAPAAFPWKATHFSATAPASVEYLFSDSAPSTMSPGPVVGQVSRQRLRFVKSDAAHDNDAFWYYRHVAALLENTGFNAFATSGFWQILSFDVSIRDIIGIGSPTPSFWIGWYDVTAATWHRAKFAFNVGTGVLTLIPTAVTGSAIFEARDRGNLVYRVTAKIRSSSTLALHQRRPGIYMEAPPSDTLVTRELDVIGATHSEQTESDPAPDFWSAPKEVIRAKPLLSTLLFVNTQKTVAMTTKTSGHNMRVVNTIGVPVDNAKITIVKNGLTKTFEFDSTSPAGDADPAYTIPTNTESTIPLAMAHFAADVNTAFGAGTARVIPGYTGIVDLYNVQSASDTGDTGDRLSITDLHQIHVWIKEPGYFSEYFFAFRQGTNFLKVAAITARDLSTTGDTLPTATSSCRCVGATVPGGYVGNEAKLRDTCEKDGFGGTQQFQRGVFFSSQAAAALDGAPALGQPAVLVNSTNPSDVAQVLAFRDFTTTEECENGIKAKWTWTGSHTVEVQGSTIRLASSVAFDEFRVADSFGGDALVAFKDTAKRVTELPPNAQDGARIRISRDSESKLDDEFAVFDAETPGAFGPGKWVEGLGPDVPVQLDEATMVHQIVLKQDNGTGTLTTVPNDLYFEYGTFQNALAEGWIERTVGDTLLAKTPAFVGAKITHVAELDGRLMLPANQNVVFSEVHRFNNFFRTKTAFQDPRDPIDVQIGNDKAYPLRWALPLDRLLILADRATLFSIQAKGDGLTSETVERRPILRLPTNEFGIPVAYDRSLFIPVDRGNFAGVIEVFPSPEGASAQYDESTAAIPTFIPGRITQLAFCVQEGILCAIADGAPSKIFVMMIAVVAGKRELQGWGAMDFGAGARVSGISFYDTDLTYTVFREFGASIDVIPMRRRFLDKGLPHATHLDRRVSEDTPGYSKALSAGNTVIQLPFRIPTGQSVVALRQFTNEELTILGTGTYTSGGRTLSTVTIQGNVSADTTKLWIGFDFPSRLRLGGVRVKGGTGQLADAQAAPVVQGRTQDVRAQVAFHDTAGFDCNVYTRGGKPTPKSFLAGVDSQEVAIPGERRSRRFKFTGIPADDAKIQMQRAGGDFVRAIQFKAGGGADTSILKFINTTTANTLPLVAAAFGAAFFGFYELPGEQVDEFGLSTFTIPRSGMIFVSETGDSGNAIAIEESALVERGTIGVDLRGEADELEIEFRNRGWRPFAITAVDAMLAYHP